MGAVLQSAFLKALGWSLVDSLWQLGIIWVLYVLVTARGRNFSASQRHNLALFSLSAGALWFLVTLVVRLANHGGTLPGEQLTMVSGLVAAYLDPALPFLSVGYLLTATFLLTRLSVQLHHTRRLATAGLSKVAPELRVFTRGLAAQLGIRKEIRIWISQHVDTPLTVGFWKPVILLPVAIVNNLSLAQTESVILHELYHIKKNDFLLNLLIAVADILLFFNPFSACFRKIIQRERENRCDDIVLQFRYQPAAYAQALLILEQQRPAINNMTIAATGVNKFLLLARVKRVLTGKTSATPVSQRLSALFFSAVLLGYIALFAPGKSLVNATAVEPMFVPAAYSETTPAQKPGTGETATAFETVIPDRENAIAGEDQPTAKTAPEIPAIAIDEQNDDVEKNLAGVIVSENIEKLVMAIVTEPVTKFVEKIDNREFSINIEMKPATPSVDISYPYVPSSSFSYQEMEDTALPKKTATPGFSGKLQMLKSLDLIDQIDWDQMDENLEKAGERMDVVKLQAELKKAIANIDWKSLNADLGKVQVDAGTEIAKYKALVTERYQQFQKARLQRLESIRAAESKIIADPLHTGQRTGNGKVKKVVSI